MKKTIYALFLCFCFLCLPYSTAYAEEPNVFESNAFRIVRKSYADGHISLSYIFPVNSSMLKKEGFSEEERKVFRFYLTTYVNALAKSNAEKACEGVSVENSKYFMDVDGIGFSVVFENLDAQKRFFGTTDEDEKQENNKKSTGVFIKKTLLKTSFPISSKKTAGDLKMVCLMALSSWSNNSDMSQTKKEIVSSNYENSKFIYDFALQSRGLKSKLMYEDENFVHNVFIKSVDELETNPEIEFWVTSVNTPAWYLTALGVVVSGMIVAFITTKAVKNKKK